VDNHRLDFTMAQRKGSPHSPKPNVDFVTGKPPPRPSPRPTQRSPARGRATHSNESGWLSAGLFRILIFGAIAVGGVAVVMWLRDVGSAAGVNWLH
jgi:hypothetical protein